MPPFRPKIQPDAPCLTLINASAYNSHRNNADDEAGGVLQIQYQDGEHISTDLLGIGATLTGSSKDLTCGDEADDSLWSLEYSYAPTSPQLAGADLGKSVATCDRRDSGWRFSIPSDAEAADSAYLSGHSSFDVTSGAECETDTSAGDNAARSRSTHEQRRTKRSFRPSLTCAADEDTATGALLKLLNSPTRSSRTHQHTYTNNLGVPDGVTRGAGKEPSIISDAGDQQALRRKRRSSPKKRSPAQAIHYEKLYALLSKDDTRLELQESIHEAMQSTRSFQGHDQEFLPKKELDRLITPESVTIILTQKASDKAIIERYARTICEEVEVVRGDHLKIRSFRKIFALLVIAGLPSSIAFFVHADVSDLDLPLVPNAAGAIRDFYHKDDVQQASPLQCFKRPNWGATRLRNFNKYQWTMLAPFFAQDSDGDVKHYLLSNHHILPFIASSEEEEMSGKNGGYGKVLMRRIHIEQHNFQDAKLSAQGFAIKQQIHDEDLDVFQNEVAVLKKFSGKKHHKHIIPLLATFEQFRMMHLIFYRAQGDLFAFWNDIYSRPNFAYLNILWLAEQCEGLAEGLLQLHRLLTFKKPLGELQKGEAPSSNG